MVLRRRFIAGALAATVTRAVGEQMPAVYVPTFDQYPTAASVAFGIMAPLGIVGTAYANPFMVGQADNFSTADLTLLAQSGWEIGGYAQGVINGATSTMVDMWLDNRVKANDRLRSIQSTMDGLGFRVTSIAPTGRSWNGPLANLARGRFAAARAPIQGGAWQSLPVPDPMNVPLGGTNTWSNSDTLISLKAQLDSLIATGGMWVSVTHKVGPTGDSLTIPTQVFSDFMAYVKDRVTAGVLVVKTVTQAFA